MSERVFPQTVERRLEKESTTKSVMDAFLWNGRMHEKGKKMENLISRLSDLRSQYSCFDENERDAYHTLSEAIEALKAREEVSDLIRKQDLIDAIYVQSDDDGYYVATAEGLEELIKGLPSAEPEKVCVAEIKIEGEELQRCIDKAMEQIKAEGNLEIIRCKDCRKHNISTDVERNICPLTWFRGKAQGHEFDYQFCCFGERKEQ